jgi:hypothetical protein
MFTATESAEVWDRWQRGEGLKLIGRLLGPTSSAIIEHLKPHGGIRPVLRRRSRLPRNFATQRHRNAVRNSRNLLHVFV